jgi:hypothetical protein
MKCLPLFIAISSAVASNASNASKEASDCPSPPLIPALANEPAETQAFNLETGKVATNDGNPREANANKLGEPPQPLSLKFALCSDPGCELLISIDSDVPANGEPCPDDVFPDLAERPGYSPVVRRASPNRRLLIVPSNRFDLSAFIGKSLVQAFKLDAELSSSNEENSSEEGNDSDICEDDDGPEGSVKLDGQLMRLLTDD